MTVEDGEVPVDEIVPSVFSGLVIGEDDEGFVLTFGAGDHVIGGIAGGVFCAGVSLTGS